MGKSSKDKRDAYYRLAKEQGWRARSAFKLIQLDEQFNLFEGVTRVVDLCAAPGSWSQVLSRILIKGESFGRRAWEEKRNKELELIQGIIGEASKESEDGSSLQPREGVRIVAVDLQPMSPLEGITTLVADITHPTTIPRILKALDPDSCDTQKVVSDPPEASKSQTVDLVLSDGAPDVTGLHDMDIYIQSQLLFSALDFALRVLRPGGKFVAKIFRGRNVDLIYAQLRCFFKEVYCAKPRSSRASSLEAFVVCQGFSLPNGYDPAQTISLNTSISQVPNLSDQDKLKETGGQRRITREDGLTVIEFDSDGDDGNRWIAPFVACGDLSAWDSDATYHLPKDRVSLDPVQPPTAPPYKRALEERRKQGGMYGKPDKS